MPVKVAQEWFSICGGCEVTILDVGEPLLDVLPELEFVHMPIIMDHKLFGQTGENTQADIPVADIGIITGGIRNEENRHLAALMRSRVNTLIAMGSCACYGGVPALANQNLIEDIYERVYHGNSTTDAGATPKGVLPALTDRVYALDEVVKVDIKLPGCPTTPDMFVAAVMHLLKGTPFADTTKSVCDECPTIRERKAVSSLKRPLESVAGVGEDLKTVRCFLEQGFLCQGPATRGGCGGMEGGVPRCVRAYMPCRGCYGPLSDSANPLVDMMGVLASIGLDPKQIPDRAAQFNRFAGSNGRLRSLPKRSAMGKTLVIQPVSRIEGHARVTIQLDDSGNVSDARVNVIELRGFEKFCVGRPVEEMPRITTRICGVCPFSQHMAAAKANDAVFGVEPPPTGKKLRQLCNSLAYMEEHILHFYVLGGPDFIMGPRSEYPARNVIGIVGAAPEIAKQVVRVRHMCARMLEIVAGKSIHPDAAVPGGFSKPLQKEERDALLPMAQEALELAKFSIKYAKDSIFPKYLDAVKTIGTMTSGFLGTVTNHGALDLYDGQLRMMYSDGSYEEFEAKEYTDYIGEHVEDWTYLTFPYAKRKGPWVLEDNAPSLYRVNTLARINVCDYIPTPLAQKELEEFRKNFGRPAQLTLLYHWARLIELLYNAEFTVQLLNDPEITGRETRIKVTPRAARGVGCVEAPRGTLIHDYTTDENGLLTHVNLIVATCQNNSAINLSVQQAARTLIKDGKYDQGSLNMIEMAIRAYDPCLSCATHRLDGTLPVRVDIVGPDGKLIETLNNS